MQGCACNKIIYYLQSLLSLVHSASICKVTVFIRMYKQRDRKHSKDRHSVGTLCL